LLKNAQLKSKFPNASWEVVEVSVVDMSAYLDERFDWICFLQDTYSKYHIIWPLKEISSSEIFEGLQVHAVPYFDWPKVLKLNKTIEILKKDIEKLVLKHSKGRGFSIFLINLIF
jgi:hypothetical protein